MNKVILMGRLTRDPEVRYTQGEESLCIARFTLAVDRNQKKQEGRQSADFISCVAFGNRAQWCEKWMRQGIRVTISGRIQTGSYTNRDGVKVYTTDVAIEEIEFAESKSAAGGSGTQQAGTRQQEAGNQYQTDEDGFMHIPDGVDEELPFY